MLSLLLLTALLAACTPTPDVQPTASRTPAQPEPERTPASVLRPEVRPESLRGVSVEIWHPWFALESRLLQSQVAQFNRENEWGITVRLNGHSNFSELYENVTSALPGGAGPQAVISLPEHAIAWDSADFVVDLTDYVEDPLYGLSNEDVQDFPPGFWNQEALAGIRLGVPAQRSATFLLYNQDWARDLGFEEPPQTDQGFREQACAANASLRRDDTPSNDNQGGWLVSTDAMTLLSWLTAFGGGVLDGNSYRFLSPRNLEAVAFLKQLYDDACAWTTPESSRPEDAFAGRTALLATAPLGAFPTYTRAMAEADNSDQWTVLPFPGSVQQGLVAYGSSFVVLRSTPAQQLASWLFIRWMLAQDRQTEWVEATGLFPLRTSMLGTLESYARSHPQWATATEYIPAAQIHPQLSSWRQVRVMMGDGFDAMFRSNTPAGRVAEILAIMDRTAADLTP